jgi:hypothetical protein
MNRTPSLSRGSWVARCALAETVGMTAAATAARTGDRLVGTPATAADSAVLISLAVAGGIVEALALGVAMAGPLLALAPTLPRRRWVVVTTLVAGLSWAAGMIPAALPAEGDAAATSATPAIGLILAAALAIGLATGALLGAAQALVLRGHVRHPWRWCAASAAAWPVPMAVIFTGAGTAGAGWPAWQVLLLAAATGAVAGGLLGLVLGWLAPGLAGQPASARLVLRLLGGRFGSRIGATALSGMVGLSVRGRRTGRWYTFPVMAAADGDELVVLVGHADRKQWWRNVLWPTGVRLLRGGSWHDAVGRAVEPGDPSHPQAYLAYLARFPRADAGPDAVLVRISPSPPPAPPADLDRLELADHDATDHDATARSHA